MCNDQNLMPFGNAQAIRLLHYESSMLLVIGHRKSIGSKIAPVMNCDRVSCKRAIAILLCDRSLL